jgi:prepilin peptidase CpaA
MVGIPIILRIVKTLTERIAGGIRNSSNQAMTNFLIILLTSILVVAAVLDLRFQKIPNLLTYPTMGIALICHFVTDSLAGLLFSLGGLAIGIAVLILPYLMGGMGAGDAKLMGAAGAVLGPKGVFMAFLFTAVVGGAYALLLLLINRGYAKRFMKRHVTTFKTFTLTRQFIPVPADKDEKDEKKPKMCYGIAIAIGTLSYMFLGLLGYDFLI